MPFRLRNGRDLLTVVFLHLIGGLLGAALSLLHVPLAWMVGPLVLTAAFAVTRDLPRLPSAPRRAGQLIVGGAIGLYMTPDALGSVLDALVPIIASSVGIAAVAVPIALLLGRVGRTDAATALFAALPGGPMEMAQLAKRYGGQGSLVALTQTMRIAAIVILIPPLLVLLGNPVVDVIRIPVVVSYPGLALALVIALAGALLAERVRMVNPWFVGPLIGITVVSLIGVPLSGVPGFVLAGAQILLGVSLGGMFDRHTLRLGKPFIAIAALTTVLLIGVTLLMALVMAQMGVSDFSTLALANAPGSVTEMSIAAKAMHLDVSLVASVHIIRILILTPNAAVFFRMVRRMIEPHLPPSGG
jgi:membrane AbrB-like protein